MARRSRIDLERWGSAEGRAAVAVLARRFEANGYYRTPRPSAPASPTHRGYECRFSARSAEDCAEVVALLGAAGLTPGAPFAKGSAFRIPIYGREAVELLWHAFRRIRTEAAMTPRRPAPCGH